MIAKYGKNAIFVLPLQSRSATWSQKMTHTSLGDMCLRSTLELTKLSDIYSIPIERYTLYIYYNP